jgi:methylsterol monooxygenase
MNLSQVLEMETPLLRTLWNAIESVPVEAKHHVFVGLFVVPLVFFYFYGFLLFMVDFLGTKKFRECFKVQKDIVITSDHYWAALKVSFFNWFALTLPYLYWLSYIVIPWLVPETPSIPTVKVFFRDMIVFVLVEEVLFYFSHRALHFPSMYGPIHKFHHTFTAPFGIAAVYAHPIEHMLSNVIPVSVGALIMRSHPVLPTIWGVAALFNTMTVHSGYDFSMFLIFPAPYFHDWHHERFNENFGAIQLLDYVFNTNKNFLLAIGRDDVYIPRISSKSI